MKNKHNFDKLNEHLKKIGAFQNPNEKININVTSQLIQFLKRSYNKDLKD